MARNEKIEGLTTAQQALLAHLSRSGGKYFNEMCRELEGKLSRRTIAKELPVLEKRSLARSALVRSDFVEDRVKVHRWVRRYEAVKD